MEEKPEGTPNPLNPSLNVVSAEPSATPVKSAPTAAPTQSAQPVVAIRPARVKPANFARSARPIDMVRPVATTSSPASPRIAPKPVAPEPMAAPEPVTKPEPKTTPAPVVVTGPAPVAGPEPVAEPEPATSGAVENLGVVTDLDGTPSVKNDPTYRPMTKVATPKELKTKKPHKERRRTKLFIGMMISLMIAVGCGVAAMLILLNTPKEDMVAIAVNRLASGDILENIRVDGTIEIVVKDKNSPIDNVKISVGGEMVVKSKINSAMAKIDAKLKDGGSFSANIAEIYAATGDLYLKVEGVSNLLENMNLSEDLAVLEPLDGEWIRIPLDDSTASPAIKLSDDQELSCLVNLLGDIDSNSNTLSGMYLKNPFVTSTDEDLTIKSKYNPIYQVVINNQNFRAFVDDSASTPAISNLASCLGYQDASSGLVSAIQNLPDMYVEVDEEANLTRLYIDTSVGLNTVRIDLDFSYPENVNVPEPTEYQELEKSVTPEENGELEAVEEPENVEEVEIINEAPETGE